VRVADAPAPGWFPDPENRARLRWWDGSDWTDFRRAVPSTAEITAFEELQQRSGEPVPGLVPSSQQLSGYVNQFDTGQFVQDIRAATLSEVERAADEFARRADAAVRSFTPLVTQYSNRFFFWLRTLAILAVVLFVLWVLFQAVFEASFFEWIGDRIDNLVDRINDDGS
jgi:hypothetical protein